jgi:hypothetical protein
MYGALLALRILTRKYEFRDDVSQVQKVLKSFSCSTGLPH